MTTPVSGCAKSTAGVEIGALTTDGSPAVEATVAELQEEVKDVRSKPFTMNQERDHWRRKFIEAQKETFRMLGESGKQNRETKTLKDDLHALRKQNEDQIKLVRGLESQNKKLKKDSSPTKKLIRGVELRTELKERQKPPLTRSAGKTASDEIKKLKAQVETQQDEIDRLGNMHRDASCDEHRRLNEQQLKDAQALQTAAELETEGLRYIEFEIKELREQHLADTKMLSTIISAQSEAKAYMDELEEMVESLGKELRNAENKILELEETPHGCPDVYIENFDHESCKSKEVLSLKKGMLSLANVQILSVEPESPQISLHTVVLKVSTVQCQTTTPKQPVPVNLSIANIHCSSTTTHPPTHNTLPTMANPELRAKLQDLGASIMNLPHLSSPTRTSNPALHKEPSRLNVALTVHLKPSDRKIWTLLQRVQSAISKTSTLDMHGPKELVEAFVSEMVSLEADHMEKAAAAVQWQKVALENVAEADALRKELEVRPKCVVVAHRYLRDELEAKEVQYAMQETLMAEWRRKAGQG